MKLQISIVLTGLIGWAAFGETAVTNTPPQAVTPASRIDNEGYGTPGWWRDRHEARLHQIATKADHTFDLVFFGDSITHHWESCGKDTFAKLRETYSILNLGYSGDHTENLLWRGQHGELDGYRAKCIMLMIGTNNTWHRNEDPKNIAAGIRLVLDVMREKQPQAKILLLPIFPFGESENNPKRVNNEKVNAIIRDFADGNNIIWVDFNAQFLDEKGDMIKSAQDRCHPTAEAYRNIWMPAVLPHFKEIVGK